MPCEFCPDDGDESECPLCRADDEYRDRQRAYSRLVSAVTLSLLTAIAVVAAVCGLVNKLSH